MSAESSLGAGPQGLGAWATAAWVVVIALACLTTLAAAEVSVVLALVYWSALVMIFVTPHGGRAKAARRETGAGEEPAGLEMRQGDVLNDLHDAVLPDSIATVLEPPAPEADSREQPAWEAETARPRRGRVRVRKSAKPAGEPSAAPVTWVRVGPGRFVRADVAAAGAHAEAHVATHDSAEQPSLETGVEARVEAVGPIEPAAESVPEPSSAVAAAEESLEIEAYGTAPSAFEPDLSESLDEVDLVDAAELANQVIADGEKLFEVDDRQARSVGWRRRVALRQWRSRVVRTTLNASRTSERRAIAVGGNRRSGSTRSDASQGRMRQVAGRAASRIAHVERGFRPRSPPARGPREAHRALIESSPRARRSRATGGNALVADGQPGSWRFESEGGFIQRINIASP